MILIPNTPKDNLIIRVLWIVRIVFLFSGQAPFRDTIICKDAKNLCKDKWPAGKLHFSQQEIVQDNHGGHRLNDGHSAGKNAGVVSPAGFDGRVVSVNIHGLLLH